jgi:hypothetical protein
MLKIMKLLDFEVDKLSHSIENAYTGEIFKTETLGAILYGSQRMIIETNEAKKLVNDYFPDFLINN